MILSRLLMAYFFLIFYIQARIVLGDVTTKYYQYTDEPKLTWDEANEFCRKKNLVLPFCFTQDNLDELRKYIIDNALEPPSLADGYWMNGRADGRIFRWDYGSKEIDVNGWYDKDPTFKKRADGVVQGCMEIINGTVREFIPGGLTWRSMWCDEKRPVICQNYE